MFMYIYIYIYHYSIPHKIWKSKRFDKEDSCSNEIHVFDFPFNFTIVFHSIRIKVI